MIDQTEPQISREAALRIAENYLRGEEPVDQVWDGEDASFGQPYSVTEELKNCCKAYVRNPDSGIIMSITILLVSKETGNWSTTGPRTMKASAATNLPVPFFTLVLTQDKNTYRALEATLEWSSSGVLTNPSFESLHRPSEIVGHLRFQHPASEARLGNLS